MDFEYFKYYRRIAIDLSRQIELENPDLKQKINFIEKKKEETTFEFSQNSVTVFCMYKNGTSKDCKFTE